MSLWSNGQNPTWKIRLASVCHCKSQLCELPKVKRPVQGFIVVHWVVQPKKCLHWLLRLYQFMAETYADGVMLDSAHCLLQGYSRILLCELFTNMCQKMSLQSNDKKRNWNWYTTDDFEDPQCKSEQYGQPEPSANPHFVLLLSGIQITITTWTISVKWKFSEPPLKAHSFPWNHFCILV